MTLEFMLTCRKKNHIFHFFSFLLTTVKTIMLLEYESFTFTSSPLLSHDEYNFCIFITLQLEIFFLRLMSFTSLFLYYYTDTRRKLTVLEGTRWLWFDMKRHHHHSFLGKICVYKFPGLLFLDRFHFILLMVNSLTFEVKFEKLCGKKMSSSSFPSQHLWISVYLTSCSVWKARRIKRQKAHIWC